MTSKGNEVNEISIECSSNDDYDVIPIHCRCSDCESEFMMSSSIISYKTEPCPFCGSFRTQQILK